MNNYSSVMKNSAEKAVRNYAQESKPEVHNVLKEENIKEHVDKVKEIMAKQRIEYNNKMESLRNQHT